MIERIDLDNFGCFVGDSFELSQTTVFVGPNEAGKTTLFDALHDGLCHPRRSTAAGKRIEKRYGSNAGVSLQTSTGNSERASSEDFLNIHAIRAAELTFADDYAGSWDPGYTSALKARVLSAGVDIDAIVADLRKAAGDKGSLRHNKERKKKEVVAAQKREELGRRHDRRDAILQQQVRLKDLDGEIARLRELLKIAESHHAQLAASVELQRRIRARVRLRGQLERLDEHDSLATKREALDMYASDRAAELDELEKAAAQAGGKAKEAALALEAARRAQAAAELDRGDLEPRVGPARISAQRAEELRGVLTAAQSKMRLTTQWRLSFIAVAVSMVLVAAAAFIWDPGPIVNVVAGAAAIAGFALAMLSRKVEQVEDADGRDRAARQQREKWNARVSQDQRLEATTLPGLLAELDRIIRRADKLEDDLNEISATLPDLSRAAVVAEQAVYGATTQGEAAAAAITRWLEALRVATRDEYVQKVVQRRDLDTRLTELSVSAESADRATLERRLKELDDDGVPEGGMDEAALRRLQRDEQAAANERKAVEGRLQMADREQAGLGGEMKGALGGLPEAIASLEREIGRLAQEIREMERDKKSAALAAEIFVAVDEDAESDMSELSASVVSYLRAGLGAGAYVAAMGLADDALKVRDATGEIRTLASLSSGTRDMVVFASRLALAERTAAMQLLVLDEPFVHLDAARERGAIEMLQDFQAKTDWQVIVLTKEERLAGALEAVLRSPTVHRLGARALASPGKSLRRGH